MRISQNKQGTDEWLEERKGIPTASEFAPFMVQSTKAATAARRKYIAEKLTDGMEGDDFEREAYEKASAYLEKDPWIRRGKELEPIAREKLSSILGFEIIETGLIFHDSNLFAGSPDGLVVINDEWSAGVEIKCHNRKRHLADLLAGTLPDDHKYQVHGSMVVTGLRQWHYFGFHPALPYLHLTVDWDSFTDELQSGLLALGDEIKATRKQLIEITKAQNTP